MEIQPAPPAGTAPEVAEARSLLRYNEAIIFSMAKKMGEHLLQIRDSKCYRFDYDTFEDYCQTRLGMTRQRAYGHITLAEVKISIGAEKATSKQIAAFREAMNETQAAALARVPEEQRVAVAEKAVRQAEAVGRKVTAKIIDAVARDIPDPSPFPPPEPPPPASSAPPPPPLPADDEFTGIPAPLPHTCPKCGWNF